MHQSGKAWTICASAGGHADAAGLAVQQAVFQRFEPDSRGFAFMGQGTSSFYPHRDPETGLREDQCNFLESAVVSLDLPSLFYASLRDPLVFEAVIGRPMSTTSHERVTLEGFGIGKVNVGPGFPGIFTAHAAPHSRINCVLVHDLTRFEQTMVAWYEWDEYRLERVHLADGRMAQAFVPDLEAIRREHGPFDVEPWSFSSWRSSNLDETMANARKWMTQRPCNAALMEARFFTDNAPAASRRAAG